MPTIFFVTDRKPKSYNAKNKKKNAYKKGLQQEFEEIRSIYGNLPLDKPLYSKVIYIYNANKDSPDIDNLSKPLIDAFSGIIYSDDNIINHRICTRVKLDSLDISEINLSLFPNEAAEKLVQCFDLHSENIIYLEIGDFRQDMIRFGGEQREVRTEIP